MLEKNHSATRSHSSVVQQRILGRGKVLTRRVFPESVRDVGSAQNLEYRESTSWSTISLFLRHLSSGTALLQWPHSDQQSVALILEKHSFLVHPSQSLPPQRRTVKKQRPFIETAMELSCAVCGRLQVCSLKEVCE